MLQNGLRKSLPFKDKRDFEEQKRGFIAAPSYKQIMAEAGNVAWDMGSYGWLLQGKDFDSIHPSLQRQGILNMAYGFGLYDELSWRNPLMTTGQWRRDTRPPAGIPRHSLQYRYIK